MSGSHSAGRGSDPGAAAGGRWLAPALAAEGLGTFGLVFAGCGAIVINTVSSGVLGHVGVALTFGLVVMTLIYSLGAVSGCHLNPAVTLGLWSAGQFPGRRVSGYLGAQLLGALAACGLIRVLFGNIATLGATLPAGPWWQSFVLEAVLTAALLVAILRITAGPNDLKPFAGIAIGGVIGLEAMFAGPISGASMNPARSLGPAIVSLDPTALSQVWIYLAAPILGGWAGVYLAGLLSDAEPGAVVSRPDQPEASATGAARG